MRAPLIILITLLTAFSATAQTPVKVVSHYPAVMPPAEIHFTDGNMSSYPIMRISKEAIRVDTGDSQSLRIPLSYVDRIQFKDGCTLFFENGEFKFDSLVQPALLKNESGGALLEGVLPLSKEQTASLMGPAIYPQFRKQSIVTTVGIATIAAGFTLTIPYMGAIVSNLRFQKSAIDTFKDMSPAWKGVTIGGGCVFLAGTVLAIIGNSGCNKVVASYNDGVGLAYSF